jgi:protocatechuate 3,4-dioxygenase beta subunit
MPARYITLLLCVCVMFAVPRANGADGHTIRGIVTNTGGAPLANAKVLLRADETRNAEYGTFTASDGSFILRNVVNGRYEVSVTRDGYLPWTGPAKPSWPSPIVTLVVSGSSGDRNLDIQLMRAGSISGRILNEDGEAIIGAHVRIYKRSNFFGEWRFNNIAAPGTYAVTNDLGEYRAYSLPPGKYIVGASYSQSIVGSGKVLRVDQSNLSDRYVPTFYPNVAEPSSATSIEVGPESEARGVDFVMSRGSAARIRGRLVDCGSPSPGSVDISLNLRLAGISQPLLPVQGRILDKEGNFEFTAVPAGNYQLSVLVRPPNRSITQLPLEVGNREIADLVVRCAQRVIVHGTVRFDGNMALPGSVEVMLEYPDRPGTGYGGRIKPDGTFTIQDIPAGKYRVRALSLPNTAFVKAVRLGNTDVLQNGAVLEGSVSDTLEILLSDTAASVSGIVVDANHKPVPGALVLLAPGLRLRDRTDLYSTSTADETGRFQFRRLSPGDYELYAWPYADAVDAYRDPDFLVKYSPRAKAVHLDPGTAAMITADLLE